MQGLQRRPHQCGAEVAAPSSQCGAEAAAPSSQYAAAVLSSQCRAEAAAPTSQCGAEVAAPSGVEIRLQCRLCSVGLSLQRRPRRWV